MLPRQYRLTKSDNIPAILKKGGMAMSRHVVARFRPNKLTHHRFSVIVSQKIANKAVKRNEKRRQIHEILRLNYDQFPSESYFDILILPKKAIIGTTYHEIERSILSIIPKISL